MSPEQQKYVIENKLQKKEIYLLKKFRYISMIFTVVVSTLLSMFYNPFFLAIMIILIVYDVLISPKSMIIIDGDKIHEITNFSAKIYQKNDYTTLFRYLVNKRSKTMYFTYAITKQQLLKIVK